MKEKTIIIPIEEYTSLIKKATYYDVLMDLVLHSIPEIEHPTDFNEEDLEDLLTEMEEEFPEE